MFSNTRIGCCLLLLAGLAGGCFNPDYGDGGFLCNKKPHDCPDPYKCVDDGHGQKRCVLHPKEADLSPGPDLGDGAMPQDLPSVPEGPIPDQGLASFSCPVTATRTFSGDLLQGPGTFDLLLNQAGRPLMVVVDSSQYVRVWSTKTFPNKWEQSPTSSKVMGKQVAGTLDEVSRLHVVYAGTDSLPRLTRIKPADLDTAGWSPPTALHATLKVEDLDISSNFFLSKRMYYAVSGQDVDSTTKTDKVLVGRITSGGIIAAPTHYTFCTKVIEKPRFVRVAARSLGSKDYSALSFCMDPSGPDGGGWQLSYFGHLTDDCPSMKHVKRAGHQRPWPLAVDDKHAVRGAASMNIHGTSPVLGDLAHSHWTGSSTAEPAFDDLYQFKLTDPTKKTVDARSMDLALYKGQDACVSAFIQEPGGSSMGLRLLCQKVGSVPPRWVLSNTLAKIPMADYKVLDQRRATGTRIAIDQGGQPEIHVAFLVLDSGKHILKYHTCKLPK